MLQDDYYIDVLDWSIKNNIVVGLGNIVYTWNYDTTEIQKVAQF